MDVVSTAWRTDLMLRCAEGAVVVDRGDHLVVRTPDNPHFHWGNFLLLSRAPARGAETEHWLSTFAEEFPRAPHLAFGVDPRPGSPVTTAELRGFAAAGLEVSADDVLLATEVGAPARVDAAEVRPLSGDDDWRQRLELELTLWRDEFGPTYEPFARRATAAARALTEAGAGRWYGAFVDGRLVSGLGVFRTVDRLARYQSVATLPAYRRRGLAGALVHAAGRYATDELRCRALVIVAEAGGDAGRIYRRLGFRSAEHQLQAYLNPGS